MSIKHNSFFMIIILISCQNSLGMNNQEDIPNLNLSDKRIAIQTAYIHENKSVTHVTSQPAPGTIQGSIQRGLYDGIQGATTQLTAGIIISGATKGVSFIKESLASSQEKLDQETLNKMISLKEKIDTFKTMQSVAKNKETIEGYESLIKQCKDEMENILKAHLAQTTKQAKIAG